METAMKVEIVPVSEIKPYHRNPRNNQNGVEKVAESIKLYGCNQPITVDQNNEIVTGHTRYKAAISLGIKNVPVVKLNLTREKITEYRIADNKTSEFSTGNMDFLIPELREVPNIDNFQVFFNQDLTQLLDVSEVAIKREEISEAKIERGQEKLNNTFDKVNTKHDEDKLKLFCPCCNEEFEMSRHSLMSALEHG